MKCTNEFDRVHKKHNTELCVGFKSTKQLHFGGYRIVEDTWLGWLNALKLKVSLTPVTRVDGRCRGTALAILEGA